MVPILDEDQYHQFAVVDGGKGVVAWWRNTNYQVGDGTTTQRNAPVDVTPNILPIFSL